MAARRSRPATDPRSATGPRTGTGTDGKSFAQSPGFWYCNAMWNPDDREVSMSRKSPARALVALAVVGAALPASAFAQSAASSQEDEVFVQQAPAGPPARTGSDDGAASAEDASPSRVYYPDVISPEVAAAARARRARQEQLSVQEVEAELDQVGRDDDGSPVEQLSAEEGARALAQLTPAERQVLLEAVEGTDICERNSEVVAILALCAQRLEDRSEEFAQDNRYRPSAEERLLGERLDGNRAQTIESAISRLARSEVEADDFSNQVLASVANSPQPGDVTPEPDNPAGELSAETQALINAIVEQFGGNTGGS